MKIRPYGDDATFVDLELDRDPLQIRRTHHVGRALRARLPDSDIVLGSGSIVIVGDSAFDELEAFVEEALASPLPPVEEAKLHIVSAIYDGPDLEDVAHRSGLAPSEVVELHAGREYLVEVVGFLPGFAYMGPLHPKLVVPRRPSPRPRIPKGSIAIAGTQTGIYPLASPGGWNLIGRALDLEPFDPHREPPILFSPGDRVRFEAVDVD